MVLTGQESNDFSIGLLIALGRVVGKVNDFELEIWFVLAFPYTHCCILVDLKKKNKW